jgi:hypothetical protein
MGSGERAGKRASFNGASERDCGGLICSRFAVRSVVWNVSNTCIAPPIGRRLQVPGGRSPLQLIRRIFFLDRFGPADFGLFLNAPLRMAGNHLIFVNVLEHVGDHGRDG